MNQSQFLEIICNSLKARERSRVHGAIGFGFASHWLKNCRESFQPITKRSNRNHVITFDSHLKTALMRTCGACRTISARPTHAGLISRAKLYSEKTVETTKFTKNKFQVPEKNVNDGKAITQKENLRLSEHKAY